VRHSRSSNGRRPYGSLVVETNISYHNQNPDAGLVVRQRIKLRGGAVLDKSKYFSEFRYGSLSTAEWHARRWKNANLLTITRGRR
jgi:hypothetical protein